jgi:hypothetical protein
MTVISNRAGKWASLKNWIYDQFSLQTSIFIKIEI